MCIILLASPSGLTSITMNASTWSRYLHECPCLMPIDGIFFYAWVGALMVGLNTIIAIWVKVLKLMIYKYYIPRLYIVCSQHLCVPDHVIQNSIA